MPLASSGLTSGLVRDATPPACQIHVTITMPFSSMTWLSEPNAFSSPVQKTETHCFLFSSREIECIVRPT